MTEIGELTLWDVSDLFAYWQENPPTHVLVASYLGVRRNSTRWGKSSRGKTNFEELAQAVIAAGGTVKKKLPAVYKG